MLSASPNRLTRALGRVHEVVARSGATDVLGRLRPCSPAARPELHTLLQCFATWSAAHPQFDEPELALLAALDLSVLVDPVWWAQVVTATTRATMQDDLGASLVATCARLDVVAASFPAMMTLLASPANGAAPDAGSLVVTLTGAGGEPPALTRVAAAIEAVHQLWTVAGDLTGQRGLLHLLATDPGPTMALHFDGAAEPLLELRAILASVREQAARLADMAPVQQAALVPEMLPVMDRIGRGGRSDALRVRGAVENGVRRLLEAGVSLHGAPSPAESPASAVRPVKRAVSDSSAGALTAADLAVADVGHLAEVIAEERRQLEMAAEPKRRLWQNAAASHPA